MLGLLADRAPVGQSWDKRGTHWCPERLGAVCGLLQHGGNGKPAAEVQAGAGDEQTRLQTFNTAASTEEGTQWGQWDRTCQSKHSKGLNWGRRDGDGRRQRTKDLRPVGMRDGGQKQRQSVLQAETLGAWGHKQGGTGSGKNTGRLGGVK